MGSATAYCLLPADLAMLTKLQPTDIGSEQGQTKMSAGSQGFWHLFLQTRMREQSPADSDKCLRFCAGSIVYHGPVGQATGFFESLGFRCPKRKGIADFLQEVTSRKDQEVGSSSLRGSVTITSWPLSQATQAHCVSHRDPVQEVSAHACLYAGLLAEQPAILTRSPGVQSCLICLSSWRHLISVLT